MATNETLKGNETEVKESARRVDFDSGYAALAYVQAMLKANKCLYNKFGGYSYRSCESILESLKPLLATVGAVVLMRDEITQIGDRYYVKATATFIHLKTNTTVDVTAYAREEECKKGMDGSQVTGASSSYARKYALNGLFAIDDGVDSDTTNDKEPEMITKEQIKEFEELEVKVENVCKRFGVKKVEELTKEQAIFVINAKRKALNEGK